MSEGIFDEWQAGKDFSFDSPFITFLLPPLQRTDIKSEIES